MDAEQSHYLNNVLRKKTGDVLRLFNGKDGEWLAEITSINKKSCLANITKQIKNQPKTSPPINLFFSPIKKKRLDILIEKAVELGVTGLCPVLMNRTENRKFNEERTLLQIIEAAEQCERLTLPKLYTIQKLSSALLIPTTTPINVCLERCEQSKALSSYSFNKGASFMVGPEGGFDNDEVEIILNTENIEIIDLGNTILRAETAAISCLSYVKLSLL